MAIFNDAATALLLKEPFFGALLMKYKHVEDPNLAIPTLCVTPSTIRYHPEFMAKLTDDEAVFAVAHEVMHAVYMHLPRMLHYQKLGIGPDGKKYDQMLMNIACDFPINHALRESKVGTLIAGVCISDKYPYTMLPEEVYCLLKQECEKNGGGSSRPEPGSGPSGGQGGEPSPDYSRFGDQFDQHDSASCDTETPAIGQAEVLEAVNVARMTRGTLPAGIDRLIEEIRKPAVSPWKRLRQLVVSSLHGRDLTSWNRLQRRYIVRGVGLPGPIAGGAGRIGIVVDTSGSIDAEMLHLFAGHMAAIMDDAKPKEAWIYWVDTKVHRVDKVTSSTALRSMLTRKGFTAPGGGGTDMPEGVEAAVADGCNSVVVLTDGYTPFGDPQPKPVIWAITSSGVTPPKDRQFVHIT